MEEVEDVEDVEVDIVTVVCTVGGCSVLGLQTRSEVGVGACCSNSLPAQIVVVLQTRSTNSEQGTASYSSGLHSRQCVHMVSISMVHSLNLNWVSEHKEHSTHRESLRNCEELQTRLGDVVVFMIGVVGVVDPVVVPEVLWVVEGEVEPEVEGVVEAVVEPDDDLVVKSEVVPEVEAVVVPVVEPLVEPDVDGDVVPVEVAVDV